jgi:transposase
MDIAIIVIIQVRNVIEILVEKEAEILTEVEIKEEKKVEAEVEIEIGVIAKVEEVNIKIGVGEEKIKGVIQEKIEKKLTQKKVIVIL